MEVGKRSSAVHLTYASALVVPQMEIAIMTAVKMVLASSHVTRAATVQTRLTHAKAMSVSLKLA